MLGAELACVPGGDAGNTSLRTGFPRAREAVLIGPSDIFMGEISCGPNSGLIARCLGSNPDSAACSQAPDVGWMMAPLEASFSLRQRNGTGHPVLCTGWVQIKIRESAWQSVGAVC